MANVISNIVTHRLEVSVNEAHLVDVMECCQNLSEEGAGFPLLWGEEVSQSRQPPRLLICGNTSLLLLQGSNVYIVTDL